MKAFHRTQTQALFSLNAENAFGLNVPEASSHAEAILCMLDEFQANRAPAKGMTCLLISSWLAIFFWRATLSKSLISKLFVDKAVLVGRQKGEVAFFEKWLSDLASLDSGSAHAPSLRSLPQSSSDVRCSPSLRRKKCEFSEQIISLRSPSYLCPSNWK